MLLTNNNQITNFFFQFMLLEIQNCSILISGCCCTIVSQLHMDLFLCLKQLFYGNVLFHLCCSTYKYLTDFVIPCLPIISVTQCVMVS